MSVFNPEIAARALMPKELLAEASSLHLCLHLGVADVMVAVVEASGHTVRWWQSFQPEVLHHTYRDAATFIAPRNWSERIFRKCTLSFDTAGFALVPTAFLQPGHEAQILHFQTGISAEQPASLPLPEMDAALLFEQDSHVRSLIKQLPNVRIFPTAYLWVKYALLSAEKDDTHFHIAHLGKEMLLTIVKNKKLMLLNRFEAQSAEDLLYYASHAALRLNMDFEKVDLRLYTWPLQEETAALLGNYNTRLTRAFMAEETSASMPFPIHLHMLCV